MSRVALSCGGDVCRLDFRTRFGYLGVCRVLEKERIVMLEEAKRVSNGVVSFDTQRVIDRLREGGWDEGQARESYARRCDGMDPSALSLSASPPSNLRYYTGFGRADGCFARLRKGGRLSASRDALVRLAFIETKSMPIARARAIQTAQARAQYIRSAQNQNSPKPYQISLQKVSQSPPISPGSQTPPTSPIAKQASALPTKTTALISRSATKPRRAQS